MAQGTDLLSDLRDRKSVHGSVMAVSMMKDEAPFLLEWFAHHLAVGFTDILVYTNDCTDGTVEMLQRLEQMGLGHHRPNVIPQGLKPQPSALKHAQVEPVVCGADWVLVFDADEFLCLNHPSGHLDGLLDDTVARGANGLIITWRIFGSSGIVDWSRDPVTEQYLHAAPPLWNKGWGVKTLFKFDQAYWKLGIHRPSIKNKHLETGFPDTVRWLNGSGQPMEDYFKFRGWRSIRRTLGYDWAQMNHYAVKSIDSYAVRKFRGNVNNKKDKYNADYWSLQDRNEAEDRSISRHAARRAEIMAALLTDSVLKNLHETALERVEARLEDFKKTNAYAALKDSLIEASKIPITDVSAKPPKARDPEKIAALMSRVEQKSAAKPKGERRILSGNSGDDAPTPYLSRIDLSGDIDCDWVSNHEIALPADPRVFSPTSLNMVLTGRFDRRHARNVKIYLNGCSHVLDVGTGVGFIPFKATRDFPDTVFVACDPRPELVEMMRRIALHNGLARSPKLQIVGASERVDLARLLETYQPDALRIADASFASSKDIAPVDLSCLKRVVIPFEGPLSCAQLRETYTPVLADKGFAEVPGQHGAGSLQFDRSE